MWHITLCGRKREVVATALIVHVVNIVENPIYTLSEAWSGVDWADHMAAQGAFGTDFYDRSTRTIVVGMML